MSVVAIARNYIGKKEKPGNSGFEDTAFEADMLNEGWQRGWAWCAVFAKMVLKKAYPLKAKDIDLYFSPGAVNTFGKCVNSPFPITPVPVVGCVVIWQDYDDGNKSWQGHVGIVSEVISATQFKSIEGNTSGEGSRNGDRVFEHTRSTDFKKDGLNVIGFIRIES
jgi:hypothetical protein